MAKRRNAPPARPSSPRPFSHAAGEGEKEVGVVGAFPAAFLPPFGPLGRAGFCALLAALVLAPGLGGVPPGSAYGSDPALGILRLLVLLGALCLLVTPASSFSPSPAGDARPAVAGTSGTNARPTAWGRGPGGGGLTGGAKLALWTLFGLTLLSLLVHSRLLTSSVLLFAMLPATLDWLCYALVFSLALTLARDRKALLLLAAALVAGAIWVTGRGLLEYREQAMVGNRGWRVYATFFSQNFTAGFLGLCLPAAAAFCLSARARLGALGLGLAAALMAGILVATGSRLGIAAAVVGMAVAFLLALVGRVRLPWARVGALLAAIALMAFAFRGPLFTRVSGDPGGQEHSREFRAWTWRGTAAMAVRNPALGTGPGTFEYRYPPHARVATTKLAHSSYLQLAAEQGWPAVGAAGIALLFVLITGLRVVRRRRSPESSSDNGGGEKEDESLRLLRCALYGGLVAGIIRSAFDSEWALLGNALPFWAAAGLVAGGTTVLDRGAAGNAPAPSGPFRAAAITGLIFALALTLLLFVNSVTLTGAKAQVMERADGAREQARRAASAWPPDPEALSLYGRLSDGGQAMRLYEQAAKVEPSGGRFFRLARLHERQQQDAEAVRALERAAETEPTSLQTWRALAEARERTGDRDGAYLAWRQLIALHEGPVGRIRAIPERPEIHPAWAYAALAAEAQARGDVTVADSLYEKAAAVVEDYADTTPEYLMQEAAGVLQTGVDLAGRRRDLRDLYRRITEARRALARRNDASDARSLQEHQDATVARLNKLIEDAAATRQ